MTDRCSPIDGEHRRLGAKLVDFGGWSMPLAYPEGTVHEHLACRHRAVMFDVSHLGTVLVDGADAFDRLQSALSNDLRKISPGHAQYTHLLDTDGSVIDDIIVWWVAEQSFHVMPNAANTKPVVNAVGGIDITDRRAIIAVQGPQARHLVEAVAPYSATVPHFGVDRITWRDNSILVAGTGYTGEDGVEFAVPVNIAPSFWEELLDAGVEPAGLGARDTLRLEAGLPLHGHELGAGITPLEAGLGWVVAWDKDNFTGKQALEAQRAAGISRRLRGIVVDGRQPPREGSAILVDNVPVGSITSGNFSPILERGIGLGFVPPELKPDAHVQVEVRGRKLEGQLVRLPFVKKGAG